MNTEDLPGEGEQGGNARYEEQHHKEIEELHHREISVYSLWQLISDMVTFEEFEEAIRRRREEFGDLLDDEAIAYLIVDENDRNVVEYARIDRISHGEMVTLKAKVVRVLGIRTFIRKSGGEGEVCNLLIADDSGKCRLVLWDTEDIDRVREGEISVGSYLKIINGKVKVSEYGKEISMGYHSRLVVY